MQTRRNFRLVQAVLLGVVLAAISVLPVLGQEEPIGFSPDWTSGIDTQFTATIGDSVSFTITAGDSISAGILALTSQALDIYLEGWAGVNSTLITVSGLPANTTLYKSDGELRNIVEITTDDLGTFSWLQDTVGFNAIKIKPTTSTLFVVDNGWGGNTGQGPGTWDQSTKTMTLTGDISELLVIKGSGITLDGAGHTIASGRLGDLIVTRSSDITVRNVNIVAIGHAIEIVRSQSTVIENSTMDSRRSCIWSLDSNNTVIDGNVLIIQSGNDRAAIEFRPGNLDVNPWEIQITNNCITAFGSGILLQSRFGFVNTHITNNAVDAHYGALTLITDQPQVSPSIPNIVTNNNFHSSNSGVMALFGCAFEIYNNNFITDRTSQQHPRLSDLPTSFVLNQSAPIGGNYWSSWTGQDSNGDGFIDIPYVLDIDNTLDTITDHFPYAAPQNWGPGSCGAGGQVTIAGSVSSDCNGPLAGVTVELNGTEGEFLSAVTATDGSFAFADLTSGNGYDVSVSLPPDLVAETPETGTLSFPGLTADTTADFTLGCLFDLTGTVLSICQGPLAGVTVALDVGSDYFPVVTGEDGVYVFEDLRYQDAVEISAVLPLGFHAVSPTDGHVNLLISQDETLDFELGCVPATGAARGMGYWKHQASVYLKGRGHAHESLVDMETNYPTAIFSHFHENGLNGIAVEGVTYMDNGSHVPLDLATIQSTLTVRGGPNVLARAKQNYLALLLNMASGKLLSFSVISDDGRTASQALQYIAELINDGVADNDALARTIGEDLNDSVLLATGVIPEDILSIAYRGGQGGIPQVVTLTQNSPNPFNPMTKIVFKLPEEQRVQMAVYAVDGRRVATLVNEMMARGSHEVVWTGVNDEGRSVPSGVYFYRMDAGDFSQTNRMLLLK